MNLPSPRSSRQGRDDRASYGGWLDLALQTSITLALSVFALTILGKWLDEILGTYPVFMVIGVLWGAGGGTASMVLKVKRYSEKREKEEKRGDNGDRS